MLGTHAALLDLPCLFTFPCTLEESGSVIAEWGVWCWKAGLVEEVVGCLVAQAIGVAAPGPGSWLLYWLGGQLGGQLDGQGAGQPGQQAHQQDLHRGRNIEMLWWWRLGDLAEHCGLLLGLRCHSRGWQSSVQ